MDQEQQLIRVVSLSLPFGCLLLQLKHQNCNYVLTWGHLIKMELPQHHIDYDYLTRKQ